MTVTAARANDDVVARGREGSECVLAFGSLEGLAREEAALRTLRPNRALPTVIASGTTLDHGAYLALSLPENAQPMGEIRAAPTLAEGLSRALLALDLAEALEARGLAWEPRGNDFIGSRDDSALLLARLRGTAKLEDGKPLQAKRVLEGIGETLLPFPLVHGATHLMRLFCRPASLASEPQLTIAEARVKLREPATPPEEPWRGLSELCDRGLKRDRNEDATAIATGASDEDRWTVLVVCDGVSSSTHAEQASRIASQTTRDALAHFACSGDMAHEGAASAMKAAIRAAHVTVCTSNIEHGDTAPPGTTIVAALIYKRRLTVGWIGDSRAYWVSPAGSELLTRDHSWVNETVAHGDMTESEALLAPLAHALTRCLGPLEGGDGAKMSDVEPDVRVRQLSGPGHVVLCTDGLWNYFPRAPDIALLVESAGPGANTASIARVLVNHALARGGGDNVSVAIYAHE
jgi:PPM family protein phosphatase